MMQETVETTVPRKKFPNPFQKPRKARRTQGIVLQNLRRDSEGLLRDQMYAKLREEDQARMEKEAAHDPDGVWTSTVSGIAVFLPSWMLQPSTRGREWLRQDRALKEAAGACLRPHLKRLPKSLSGAPRWPAEGEIEWRAAIRQPQEPLP